MVLHFIWFLIQYIYLSIYSFVIVGNFVKEKFDGEMNGYKITSVIYRIRKNVPNQTDKKEKNKLIVFLSGAYNLELHPYIIKMMHDIAHHAPEIYNKYEMVCFENPNVASILMYDEVARYIETWYDGVAGVAGVAGGVKSC